MRLDEDTLTILKNFQTINPSIQIDEGDTILTSAPTKNILAKARVPNQFPRTFAVYDLRKFLSVANMFKENGQIEFERNYLTFNDGHKSIRFGFCDPSSIVIPPYDPKPFVGDDIFVQFSLTPEMLKESINAMNILTHTELIIKGEDGKLSITTESESSNDVFSLVIGETDKTFKFIYESAKLSIIPLNYKVTLTRQFCMHLESNALEYWILGNLKSSIYD